MSVSETQDACAWLKRQEVLFATEPNTLIRACREGRVDICRWLLKAGLVTDVNASDSRGWTALHFGSTFGHLDVVRFLVLEAKALIDPCTMTNGGTPLFLAAQHNHLHIVRFLASERAEVNRATINRGSTPLFIASQKGHLEVVRFLVEEAAADVNQGRTENGTTPLFIAAQEGYLDIVRYLCETGKATMRQRKGWSPLLIAAEKGHLSVVRYLIERDPVLLHQATANSGASPVFMAAQKGHLSVVRFLVSAGASVNQTTKNRGTTPLHAAAEKGHFAVARFLVEEAGAVVNQGTTNGTTSLFSAVAKGHLEVVRYLISAGADPCMPTNNGRTPLHVSYKLQTHRSIEICCRLLAAGAPPAREDMRQEPPLGSVALTPKVFNLRVLLRAMKELETFHVFFSSVLLGMHDSSHVSTLSVLGGVEGVRVLIATYLDVPFGSNLHHLRSAVATLREYLEELLGERLPSCAAVAAAAGCRHSPLSLGPPAL